MSGRSFARAGAAGVLLCVLGSLGCGKSPSAPTSSGPPSVTSPTAFALTAVTPRSGPANFASEIRVTGGGFEHGASLTLDGVAAKVTSVTATTIVAMTPVHAVGTVDVVVTNPGGQSAALSGSYTFETVFASLTAAPTVVTSGDQLTVTWVGPSGRGCIGGGDWIALFKAGDPDDTAAANGHSDLWFVHVCGAASGTSTLSAPNQPGDYDFRFMVGGTAIARSSPVKVTASASPAPMVPTLIIDGGTTSTRQIGETFWITGTGFTPGRTVTRYIDPPVNGSSVIPGLTVDGSGNVSWAFTPTCLNFNPRNPVAIHGVDDATGRMSNTIVEIVTGSCP